MADTFMAIVSTIDKLCISLLPCQYKHRGVNQLILYRGLIAKEIRTSPIDSLPFTNVGSKHVIYPIQYLCRL
jgi:hypothetical protein